MRLTACEMPVYSAQSALTQAARRLGKMHIKCVSSKGKIFLINTLESPH